jgi:RND family efflux transporter MFP subunit
MIAVSAIGCNKKANENPANLEEIYKKQGVPVKIQQITLQEFNKDLDYNVTVSGLRETRVHARLGDQIEKIRVRLGDRVSQNQVVIDFPQDNPQASFYQARANFELADQTWQRMQRLHRSGSISQQELDGAETSFKVAEANWDAVKQSVYVRAPISGMVTDIYVREMQKVNPGDYLFTISQLDKLHGRIWISERDIKSVPRNADIIFIWEDVEKKGKITNLALSLNRDHNAFSADIEIENADYAVRSGVTGRALLRLYSNKEAIVVPRSLVQTDSNQQAYVYIAEGNNAVKRNVKIGSASELNYEITDGLNVGDFLIIQGLQLVQDGILVNIQE